MNPAEFDKVLKNCGAFCAAVKAFGGKVRSPQSSPPAVESSVASAERKLGLAFPASLRSFLLKNAQCFSFRWFLPEGFVLPDQIRNIFCADVLLDLDTIVQCELSRRSWVKDVFPNKDDPYDRVWHDKLAFLEVGNGDFWGFDLKSSSAESIAYLSHDDGEGHGLKIGESLDAVLRSWSAVGCSGSDDYGWLPFWNKSSQELDPVCENAFALRKALGVSL